MGTNECNIPGWVQALEPVRKLPTKNGSRIRRCIYDALDKGPPTWAKHRLEYSISKAVYKANASGPTKRAVLSVLADVYSKSVSQHPQEETEKEHIVSVPDITLKLCRIVLRRIASLVGNEACCRTVYESFYVIVYLVMILSYGGLFVGIFSLPTLWNLFRSVLDNVRKLREYSESNSVSADADCEVGNILILTSEMPEAVWNSGLCKVCNTDKDDDSVLLCDICDGEYHTYCLRPPLGTVPEGKWYCPSCISPENVAKATSNVSEQPKARKCEEHYGSHQSEKLRCMAGGLGGEDGSETSEDELILLGVRYSYCDYDLLWIMRQVWEYSPPPCA
ncbi:hypothetical protein Cgig2_018458 [Carnegiea gigantea]|uniref:PHD-type domain-containing protein n=1 Tax=Carnegiea gigantea TaxID=171969 RepID=A0A9Q1QES0_9CARY|nr:hypothetical protein Cgig2_018458 [Carnegiea gigantea]